MVFAEKKGVPLKDSPVLVLSADGHTSSCGTLTGRWCRHWARRRGFADNCRWSPAKHRASSPSFSGGAREGKPRSFVPNWS